MNNNMWVYEWKDVSQQNKKNGAVFEGILGTFSLCDKDYMAVRVKYTNGFCLSWHRCDTVSLILLIVW